MTDASHGVEEAAVGVRGGVYGRDQEGPHREALNVRAKVGDAERTLGFTGNAVSIMTDEKTWRTQQLCAIPSPINMCSSTTARRGERLEVLDGLENSRTQRLGLDLLASSHIELSIEF